MTERGATTTPFNGSKVAQFIAILKSSASALPAGLAREGSLRRCFFRGSGEGLGFFLFLLGFLWWLSSRYLAGRLLLLPTVFFRGFPCACSVFLCVSTFHMLFSPLTFHKAGSFSSCCHTEASCPHSGFHQSERWHGDSGD